MSLDLRALTDEELASGFVDENPIGHEQACEELFRRYRKRVYIWCRGYCHDTDEAVDLAQEIFVKVFTNRRNFDGRSRFSTWVYSIARNHCLGRLERCAERWRKRLIPLEDQDVPDDGLAHVLRDKDRMGQLDRLLDRAKTRMKDEELEAFVLHYRDGLSVKEITRALGCRNATGARTLIQNAQRKFRRMTEGKEYPDV